MTYVQFKHKFMLHGKGKPKPKLSEGRYYLAGTSIGNYALFGGGYGSGGYKSTVDALDEQMTITNPTALKNKRYQFAAASNDNYALFGGGRAGSTLYDTVDAYNKSLTRTTPTGFGTNYKRYNLAASNVGKYALFGGGENSDGCLIDVYAYDDTLTYTIPSDMPNGMARLAAASNGEYAVFGGGATYNSGSYIANKKIVRYDSSLVKSYNSNSMTHLSIAREYLAATNVGEYVLFGGGRGDGTLYSTVDVFNSSGTRTSTTGLSKSRMNLTATSLGYKAFFGGGEVNSTKQDVVDCYDTSLTHTVEKPLSVARYGLASASIGYKAIFAGGYGTNPSYSDTVDVYEDTRPDITVYIKVPRCVGYWIYTKTPQTFSIKAKQGMKYSDLVYSLNNSIEIPASTYTTLTLKMYIGQPAVWYKTSTSNAIAQVNVNTQSDPLLEDGATVDIFTDIQVVNQTGSGFNIGTYR